MSLAGLNGPARQAMRQRGENRVRSRMDTELTKIFDRLLSRRGLSRNESRHIFERIMEGEVSEPVLAALLTALAAKGESVEELVGAAEAMREKATPIDGDADAIDTCGCGGDGISTFNVSTTAAIIAAAAGATVAKHGNRTTSRASGSTEVLTELGIDVDADCATVERCLREVRIGYLNARNLHPAMKYAAPVRQVLPFRAIFNLLGPLTNPAGVRRQVVGVPRIELVDVMARALLELGATHAWVVHGADGLGDVTVTWTTTVAEVRDGRVRRFAVTPEEVGLHRGQLSALQIDSPAASAGMVRAILGGRRGTAFDHAVMNAGAALVVAGLAFDLRDGVGLAVRTIDDGAAPATLEQWQALAGRGIGGGGVGEETG